MPEILIKISRGGRAESFHRGLIGVVNNKGTRFNHRKAGMGEIEIISRFREAE